MIAERFLVWIAAAHLVVGLACLAALRIDAGPIMGLHPAMKPMKFGLSIALFLATMAVVLPALSIASAHRRVIAAILAATMVVVMVPVLVQAARGTTSHFNVRSSIDALVWRVMVGAIVIATFTMGWVAVLATVRPLIGPSGAPIDPLLATAWRAGLWLFMLAAWSGFSMGGRLMHSVGGDDGGPGLAVLNWSAEHGDLRVSHFFALHVLQILPLVAVVLARAPIGDSARWSALSFSIVAVTGVAIGTLLQAFASRPVW